MHYNVVYQKNLPPYVYHYQNITAESKDDAKKKFYEQHPYREYCEETVVSVNERKEK